MSIAHIVALHILGNRCCAQELYIGRQALSHTGKAIEPKGWSVLIGRQLFAVKYHERMGSIPIGAGLMVELVVFFLQYAYTPSCSVCTLSNGRSG